MTIWRKNTQFLKYQQVSNAQELSPASESAKNARFLAQETGLNTWKPESYKS